MGRKKTDIITLKILHKYRAKFSRPCDLATRICAPLI